MGKRSNGKSVKAIKRSGSVVMLAPGGSPEAQTPIAYGYSEMQGKRKTMEDAHAAQTFDKDKTKGVGLDGSAFFGVFDGHGGPGAARFCAQELGPKLVAKVQEMLSTKDVQAMSPRARRRGSGQMQDDMATAVQSAFKEVDQAMSQRHSMYVTDADEYRDPGTTAVTLLVTETHLVFSNLGDSRAVLSRAGEEVFSTKDHKPGDEREQSRIEQAGGWVVNGRICRLLAVARAMGDHQFKADADRLPEDQILSNVPDVMMLPRSPLDEFALLACDGVYDVMSNTEVLDFVREKLQRHQSLSKVTNLLTAECIRRGSKDNLTAVVVCFPACQRMSDGAIAEAAAAERKPVWASQMFATPTPASSAASAEDDAVFGAGGASGAAQGPSTKRSSFVTNDTSVASGSNRKASVDNTGRADWLKSGHDLSEEHHDAVQGKLNFFKRIEQDYKQRQTQTLQRPKRAIPRKMSAIARIQKKLESATAPTEPQAESAQADASAQAQRDADAQAEEELKSSLDLFEIETLNMLMMAIEHSSDKMPS